MNRLKQKQDHKQVRKNRVRAVVQGSSERPRLSVFISSHHVSAQLIDDIAQKTITSVTTVGQKAAVGTMTNKADWVGTEIAKKAKVAKIKRVVFDRNGRLYHGRVKALAEAARKAELEF